MVFKVLRLLCKLVPSTTKHVRLWDTFNSIDDKLILSVQENEVRITQL